ncbi:hypothetical protein EPD60_03770 [Flaviaesturariibacter flavus]|uniref:Uncharacterized protein n=1 Tax=Flaviaesturariibacter flavus TaxID=2502780 RepID=A0A4R1BMI7_9BACT|nr:hypothetical protein [Flaviaesturariibacter flavus]TCJ18629.1 hypothetical protein EPD60_03770 [Flaviaesturariibacter flavus]
MKLFYFLITLFFLGASTGADAKNIAGGSDSLAAKPTVSLVYFTTSPGYTGAFLQWRVSHTVGLQYFVVERSFDHKSFKPLAVVNAKSEQPVYFYKDEEVLGLRRKAYYRIKVVEAAGTVPSPVKQLRPIE